MDGNIQIERFWRSLKYEDVYIRHYDNMVEARRSIDATIYNSKRAHQALNYQTPDEVSIIAIQFTDEKAHKFREKIWGKHTNGLWNKYDDDGAETKPDIWYENWTDILNKNSNNYFKGAALTMNLFPYFEDLNEINNEPIDSIKQGSG